MPYRTTTTPPSTNAKVTVKFAGLLLLKPGATNGCEIGIHRFSNIHTFQIMLIVNKPQRPSTLIRLLNGPLTRPLAISVIPDPGTGVQAFAPTPEPFVRNNATNDVLDYRWALNLRKLHPTADFNDGARPVALLNAGVIYTPNLTNPGFAPELVQGTTTTPLYRLAADLAAAIDLTAGSLVALSWFELGDPQTLILPRPSDPPDTTYTISLLNDPPIISPPAHDELALYYKVLEVNGAPIPNSARSSLNFNYDSNTDEIPCLSVLLNP